MENSLAYAQEQDKNDELKSFRSKFYFPRLQRQRKLFILQETP